VPQPTTAFVTNYHIRSASQSYENSQSTHTFACDIANGPADWSEQQHKIRSGLNVVVRWQDLKMTRMAMAAAAAILRVVLYIVHEKEGRNISWYK